MASAAAKTYGPSYYLQFPVYPEQKKSKSSEEQVDFQKTNSLNNNLVAADVAPIKLSLQSEFYWPENTFSFGIWFFLEDKYKLCRNILDEKNSNSINNQKLQIPLTHNDNLHDMLHLCSFGASSSMFEVWLCTKS